MPTERSPLHSEDIETTKIFALEIVEQAKHGRTRVSEMARCYLITLDDLKQAESERDAALLTTHG